MFPDLRTTVYWNPNILTNEKGEAGFSFYTSESKGGGYMIIVQGTDMQGGLGLHATPLLLKKEGIE